ncbi:MAG TPA: hypothetical protein VG756_23585, partial [Pseudonocardiaceae bacterium]|nr:hypothetical protein [Pseudonocardiaceae bacterium]
GEAAAVNGLCAAIPSGSSVVFVDGPAADRLTEVVRGMCGDPVARATPNTSTPKVSSVKEVVRNIQRAGRRPVLLAGTSSELKPYAGLPRKVMTLHSTMDTDTLMAPPRTTAPLKLNVWMLEPAS